MLLPWRRSRAPLASIVVLAELFVLMRPQLVDEPAKALGRKPPAELWAVGNEIAHAHRRATGTNTLTAMAPLPSLVGIPDARLTSALAPVRYAAFLRAMGGGDPFTQFAPPDARGPAAALLGVRYLIADAPNVPASAKIPGAREMIALPLGSIFELAGGAERARLYREIDVAADQAEAAARLEQLQRGARGVENVQRRLVLEPIDGKRPPALASSGGSPPPASAGADAITWRQDDAEDVRLDVQASSPAYLFLADTWYPGWTATIDGAATPIFPAQVGFRAVHVPAGAHAVRFVYRPWSFRLGLLLTSFTILGSLGWIWRARRRTLDSRDRAAGER